MLLVRRIASNVNLLVVMKTPYDNHTEAIAPTKA